MPSCFRHNYCILFVPFLASALWRINTGVHEIKNSRTQEVWLLRLVVKRSLSLSDKAISIGLPAAKHALRLADAEDAILESVGQQPQEVRSVILGNAVVGQDVGHQVLLAGDAQRIRIAAF